MTTPHANVYAMLKAFAMFLSIVIIPFFTMRVTRSIEAARLNQEYVRIATDILAQRVEEGDDQTSIRTWAVDVLSEFSPVDITKAQRSALITGAARTGGRVTWATTDYPAPSWGTTDYPAIWRQTENGVPEVSPAAD